MFRARPLAAQWISEQLDRVVGERACVEPTLGDSSCNGEDFDALGITSGQVEAGAWGTRRFGWQGVPSFEAPRAQGAPLRVFGETADSAVTSEGGRICFAALAFRYTRRLPEWWGSWKRTADWSRIAPHPKQGASRGGA